VVVLEVVDLVAADLVAADLERVVLVAAGLAVADLGRVVLEGVDLVAAGLGVDGLAAAGLVEVVYLVAAGLVEGVDLAAAGFAAVVVEGLVLGGVEIVESIEAVDPAFVGLEAADPASVELEAVELASVELERLVPAASPGFEAGHLVDTIVVVGVVDSGPALDLEVEKKVQIERIEIVETAPSPAAAGDLDSA
jgi:hypothetical protein